MNHMARRRIARTALEVPVLGFGGATLGDAPGAIREHQALAALEAGYTAGIDYFDTSPWYGNGKSELRFGAVLRDKPRASFILSTKIGRVYAKCADPSHPSQVRWRGACRSPRHSTTRATACCRSYEQSLLRLGLSSIDALLIHDIDEGHQGSAVGVEKRLGELSDGGGSRRSLV